MSATSDILEHLVQAITPYITGYNVYTDEPPATQESNCIIFRTYNNRQDINTPLKTQTLQVLVFNINKLAGENTAEVLFNFLHNKLNYTLGSYRLLAVMGRDRPTYIGARQSKSNKTFYTYSTTYDYPYVEVS